MDSLTDPARPANDPCPDHSLLEQFLLGLASEEDAVRLEEHVLHCGACATVMETFRAEDGLLEGVRAQREGTDEPDETRVDTLIDELCKLPVTVGSTGGRPAVSELAEQLAPFLDPPGGPDEMGRFGPYRVLRILGGGGMGVVLEAEDPQLQRRVALKVMKPALAASQTARKRFLREARAAASIEHEHVVTIYRVGEHRDLPYLAMQLLKGEPLAGRINRSGTLAPEDVVRIARQIAAGLAAAHEQGIVHRRLGGRPVRALRLERRDCTGLGPRGATTGPRPSGTHSRSKPRRVLPRRVRCSDRGT